jgi:hypothetical protein
MSNENTAIPSIPAVDFGTENSDHLSTLKQAVEVIAGVRGEEARANLVSNTMLQAESVTADKLAPNAINSDKLATGAPTWDESGNATVSGGLTTNGKVTANGGVSSTTGDFSGTLSAKGGIASSAKILKEDTKGNGGKLLLEKSDTSTLAADLSIQITGTVLEINEDSGAQRGAKLDISKCSGKIGTTLIHSDNYKDYPPPKLSTAFGDTPSYSARAWCNFNAQTGVPTIRAAQNITSLTDNGVGNYTVNFDIPMPDTNYVLGGVGMNNTNVQPALIAVALASTSSYFAKAADSCRVYNCDTDSTSFLDSFECNVMVFR